MKRILVIILIFSCLLIIPIQSDQKIEVLFCEKDDCPSFWSQKLSMAKKSIDCSLYRINDGDIMDILEQKKDIVRIYADTQAKIPSSLNHKIEHFSGLMHQKFCVIDNKSVLAGSWNLNSKNIDSNNVIYFNGDIAKRFSDRFESTWHNVNLTSSPIKGEIEVYFCPQENCADIVSNEISKSKKSIHFMEYSFTHPKILTMMALKKSEHLEVCGIIDLKDDNQQILNGSFEYKLTKGLLHHKVIIIDSQIVIGGSMNPTFSGDRKNEEDLIIIRNSDIAKKFESEFKKTLNLNTERQGKDICEALT